MAASVGLFIIISSILSSIINSSWNTIVSHKTGYLSKSEVVARRCSVKKVFLEISQNSQESTCARVSFLTKLQAYTFCYRTPTMAASVRFHQSKRKLEFLRTSWSVKFVILQRMMFSIKDVNFVTFTEEFCKNSFLCSVKSIYWPEHSKPFGNFSQCRQELVNWRFF